LPNRSAFYSLPLIHDATVLVPYAELQSTMRDILVREGMEPARADHCAQLFADSSRDGVPSHGLNRFGRFVVMIRTGMVDVHARPMRVASHGALERWDGRRGPGNIHRCPSAPRMPPADR